MRIAILIEGETEKAFLKTLRKYLQGPLAGAMPKLFPVTYRGRIPKKELLKVEVQRLLSDRQKPADAVIALTDVYTGADPIEFQDARDAKQKMKEWVGPEPRFYPHAAQYEFEAWLLPYWKDIQGRAGSNAKAPGAEPEKVNHQNPPSVRIKEAFRTGKNGRKYVKARDASTLLDKADLSLAINQCPELKAFINTILTLCQAGPIA